MQIEQSQKDITNEIEQKSVKNECKDIGIKKSPEIKDLTGNRYGRLLVIEFSHIHNDKVYLKCQCDCGKEKIVRKDGITSGNTKSCGCLHDECGWSKTHGQSRSKTYRIWAGIFTRCYNKNNDRYKDYGGRGIKVCERWRKFENFLEDMGERPIRMSIDRINNNGDYCKENCRWSTNKEQSRNRSNNIFITYKDKTQCLQDWSKELNVPFNCLHDRIFVSKWSVEDSFEKPIKLLRKFLTFNGKTQSSKEWAKELGIKYTTLKHRLYLGWSVEKALSTQTQ